MQVGHLVALGHLNSQPNGSSQSLRWARYWFTRARSTASRVGALIGESLLPTRTFQKFLSGISTCSNACKTKLRWIPVHRTWSSWGINPSLHTPSGGAMLLQWSQVGVGTALYLSGTSRTTSTSLKVSLARCPRLLRRMAESPRNMKPRTPSRSLERILSSKTRKRGAATRKWNQ